MRVRAPRGGGRGGAAMAGRRTSSPGSAPLSTVAVHAAAAPGGASADSDAGEAKTPAAKEPPPASTLDVARAVAFFCFASVAMTVGNKLAVEYLRVGKGGAALPSTLVVIQGVGTLLLLAANFRQFDREHISCTHAVRWLVIFIFSGTGMYASAKSFVYVNVSFVIIMRNVGTILTTIVEYFVRGQKISCATLVSEIIIVAGMVLYGWSMVHFKDFWMGLFWCCTNTLCITMWSVTLKWKTENDTHIKELSKFEMSFYNNGWLVPYMLAIAVASGEPNHYADILPTVSTTGWVTIGVTAVCGFMLSIGGFALTRLVSATTYLVVSNLVKVLNILLGVLFLGDRFPGTRSLVGCIIALLGGVLYSVNANREKAQK